MIDLSDPISRQQTITALRALSDEDGYISAPHEVVTDVVRGLPPVRAEHGQTTQPEQTKTDKFGVKTSETCEDCISRQAAIDALEKMSANYGEIGRREWHPHIEECKSELRMLPSAPERKRGRWVVTSEFEDCRYAKCNECKVTQVFYYNKPLTNFCPNCGADMREGQDDSI